MDAQPSIPQVGDIRQGYCNEEFLIVILSSDQTSGQGTYGMITCGGIYDYYLPGQTHDEDGRQLEWAGRLPYPRRELTPEENALAMRLLLIGE